MSRLSLRKAFLWLVGLTAASCPFSVQAQSFGNIQADPFTFYYAYYLPNQQIQAMRPRPDDVINMASRQRQYEAASSRPSLYNPVSPYTQQQQDFDPLRPYTEAAGKERKGTPFMYSRGAANTSGAGPAAYYGRATQYFPTLKPARRPNMNVSSGNRRMSGGGMGGGMGGMGGGMGGMGGMG